MSSREINEFSFDEIAYTDTNSERTFRTRFTSELEKNKVDHVSTSIVVWHPPGTHISRYRWQHREVWFHTNNQEQTLIIAIRSPQSMSDNRPRFHIHRVDSNEPEWIRHVDHRLHESADWKNLNKITDAVPAHTRFVRLRLNLPAVGEGAKFKLNLYARDRDFSNKEVNCDPLVGNDPPNEDENP
ncbi:hypothetical protein [Lysobacter hankyongensis]|uniref:Uncharacterized protein n=1 Tax=Lysobacter hankyongensis TaxID=1176535 RepID=A0ABP9AHC7_9GAMM